MTQPTLPETLVAAIRTLIEAHRSYCAALEELHALGASETLVATIKTLIEAHRNYRAAVEELHALGINSLGITICSGDRGVTICSTNSLGS